MALPLAPYLDKTLSGMLCGMPLESIPEHCLSVRWLVIVEAMEKQIGSGE